MAADGKEPLSQAARFQILRGWDQTRRLDISTFDQSIRDPAVARMLTVSADFDIPETCIALSVRILDENLSRNQEARLKPDLFAATSLFIAAKVEDVNAEIGRQISARYPEFPYEHILSAEPSAFAGIEYDCYFATVAKFLYHVFAARPDLNNGEPTDLGKLTYRIAHAALLSYDCCRFLAEEVADACVFLADAISAEEKGLDEIEAQTPSAAAVLAALKASQT
jgi:hypothetical protein